MTSLILFTNRKLLFLIRSELFAMHIIKLKSFLKLLTVEYEEDYQIRTYDNKRRYKPGSRRRP